MINFQVGKIPGTVVSLQYDGDRLTVFEAAKLGEVAGGYQVTDNTTFYLQGDVTTKDALVPNDGIVLLDVAEIKGAQMVVTVSKQGGIMQTVALHNEANVKDALDVCKIVWMPNFRCYVISGGKTFGATLDTMLSDGDDVKIRVMSSESSAVYRINSNVNIYNALADLKKRVTDLEEKFANEIE